MSPSEVHNEIVDIARQRKTQGFTCKHMIGVTGKALQEKDSDLLTEQQYLEKLMDWEWNERISHHSLSTHYEKKFNKVNLLPLTKDLTILRNYLLKRMCTLSKALKDTPTLLDWKELAEATLA